MTDDSEAVLTPVSPGTALATDTVSGSLNPVPSTTGPFALGTSQISWSATDAAGNTAQARHAHAALQRLPEVGEVSRAAHVVEDHPGKIEVRVETLESINQGGGAAGHALGVDDEDDRGPRPFGHLGRGTGVTPSVIPVIEPHDPFDQGNVSACRRPGESVHVVGAGEHPAVQVPADRAGDAGVVAGVDEVRPDLERRHATPPPAKRGHEAQRDRCLAAAAFRSGNDEPFDDDLLKSKKPSLKNLVSGKLNLCRRQADVRMRGTGCKNFVTTATHGFQKAKLSFLIKSSFFLLTNPRRENE